MGFRKSNRLGCKPDKLMRDAIMLELQRDYDDPEAQGKKAKARLLVARALIKKGMKGDVPAIKEINDRSDGRIATMVEDSAGMSLEELVLGSMALAKAKQDEKDQQETKH